MTYRLPLLAAATSLLLAGMLSCSHNERGEHVGLGERVPDFHVITLGGKDITEASLPGRRSLIVFFDTWCPDCREELPEIQRVYEQIGDKALIVAIARKSDERSVREYWQANGLTLPVAVPGNTSVYDLFDRGSGTGVPQGYLIDADGVVRGFFDDTKTVRADTLCEFLLAGDIGLHMDPVSTFN